MNNRYKEALNKSLRYLSFRQRSIKEVREYLLNRGYPSPTVEKVMERLCSLKLVDDARFAHEWIYFRSRRGSGSLKLRYELISKGINETIIEEKLEELLNEEEEYRRALYLAEKRLRHTKPCSTNRKVWGKVAGYLRGRGYPHKVIYRILREHGYFDT